MTTPSSAGTDVLFATGASGPVAYRVTGPDRDRTLVFIHGVNMGSGVWDPVIERLPDYRSITLDLRGHGLSTRQGPFTMEDYLADIDAVFAATGATNAQLVGVSAGGVLSCAVAHRFPQRVRSVIAFGAALVGHHTGLDEGMRRLHEMGVADYFAWSLPRGSLPPEVADDVRRKAIELAVAGREDVDMVEEIIRSTFQRDLSYLIPGPIGRPILVVNGEWDRTCTPEGGRALATLAGGRCECLPRTGHVIPLEDPDACARLISEFFQETEPAIPARSIRG